MPMQLTAQRTLPLQSDRPDDRENRIPAVKAPKRKASARAPWEDREIPIILDSLKGRYRVRNQALIACNVVLGAASP